jgi:8-oxo-dGTP pyrophosphatase MutT (NUDIX family)
MTRSLILDPQSVPVIGTDRHLPPIAAQQLQADALRERFRLAALSPGRVECEIVGDAALIEREPIAAAVLVPLVTRPQGLQVLLTRRTDHLRDHAGQISFPGGRIEPADADAVAAALREAVEEVGLTPADIEVLGPLPPYTTVTRFIVTPVVGLVRADHALQLDSFEVAEAFEVPLEFLMTPAHHQRHQVDIGGVQRTFLSMPWELQSVDGPPRRYFIWGATAAMLRNLYRFLAS